MPARCSAIAVTGPATPPPAISALTISCSSDRYFVRTNQNIGYTSGYGKPPRSRGRADLAPGRRAELLEELALAGRAMSAATVMFHATVAERQGLSATEEKALDLLERFVR